MLHGGAHLIKSDNVILFLWGFFCSVQLSFQLHGIPRMPSNASLRKLMLPNRGAKNEPAEAKKKVDPPLLEVAVMSLDETSLITTASCSKGKILS